MTASQLCAGGRWGEDLQHVHSTYQLAGGGQRVELLHEITEIMPAAVVRLRPLALHHLVLDAADEELESEVGSLGAAEIE